MCQVLRARGIACRSRTDDVDVILTFVCYLVVRGNQHSSHALRPIEGKSGRFAAIARNRHFRGNDHFVTSSEFPPLFTLIVVTMKNSLFSIPSNRPSPTTRFPRETQRRCGRFFPRCRRYVAICSDFRDRSCFSVSTVKRTR